MGSSHSYHVQGRRRSRTIPSTGLRTVVVHDLEALRPHFDSWRRLALEAPQKLATLLPAWVDAGFRHGPEPGEYWFCCFVYLAERLVGVVPVIAGPHSVLGRSRPVLRTCDRHVTMDRILLAPDQAGPALRALLEAVDREVPSHLGIDLMAVRSNSPLWAALEEGLEGYVVRRGARYMNSFLDVSGDFDSFLTTAGKMRTNLKRYRRKLDGMGHVSVEIRKGDEADVGFLDEFLALEASGWKGRLGTAILNNENSLAYHTTLVRNFAAEGGLEWYGIRVDDHLVAARLGIRCGSALMLPKVAFDENFAMCRPGTLVTAEALKDAFSRPEIDEINHMSFAEAHRYWHMPQDAYTNVHLVRANALPVLFQLSRVVSRSIYRDYVRPNIPEALKEAHRRFRRRGDRKPQRAAESRPAPDREKDGGIP
ncbi:GNAT family N-acetyltransferase [Microvirga sp. GCM10011540]|uniref:GNAT family N-acetyltransferase n=1 Tax=Microvirga sp. GCM10011540 TaxID=3317338 RepID=UPI003622DD49